MNDHVLLLDVSPPIWRGIIPNKTTRQEMIDILGPPASVMRCEIIGGVTIRAILDCIFSPLTYQYKDTPLSNGLTPTHKIRLKAGKVWVVIEDQVGYPEISVEEFVRRYGLPEKVTWSRLRPSLRAILFCERGMMVQGGKSVTEIYYFPPMPLDTCLHEFRNEVATQNPFPGSHFLGAENPYSFNERKLPGVR